MIHFLDGRNQIGESSWVSGAVITNPGNGAVMVDTGQLREGWYFFQFVMHSEVAATFDRQHRNAANDTTLDSKEITLTALVEDDRVFAIPIKITENERLRITNVSAIVGDAQASIVWGRLDG